MPDTERADFADEICNDCGIKGCAICHWGDLVPPERIGHFCEFCWSQRVEAGKKGEPPKHLGVKPPGIPEEFSNKAIVVTTESGSVYEMSRTDDGNNVRNIYCARRTLPFSKAEVLCLAVGAGIWLRYPDGDTYELFYTTPVVSIEEKK